MIDDYQDPARRRSLQLGGYLVPFMVQEFPQLSGGMVDLDYVAGFGRRRCVYFRDPSAGALDIELPKLRLSKMAWNSSVLCRSGFRFIR